MFKHVVPHGSVRFPREYLKTDDTRLQFLFDSLTTTYRVRYVLDNFATVAEAVEAMRNVVTIKDVFCEGLVLRDGHDNVLGIHMVRCLLRIHTTAEVSFSRSRHPSHHCFQAIEDATGDSAVIEHVGGSLQIYHSRTDALVMTNEPPYNEHKEILQKYEPWGGDIPLPEYLPGSVASDHRMIRLEYYLQYTPEPQDYAEAIANLRSLINTSNVPFGAPYNGGECTIKCRRIQSLSER